MITNSNTGGHTVCRAHQFDTKFCFILFENHIHREFNLRLQRSTGSMQFGYSDSCQTYAVGTEQIQIENEPSTGNLGILKTHQLLINIH